MKIISTLIFLFLSFVFSQEFSIKSYVDKSSVFVGDEIHYTIEITFNKNLHIKKPGPGESLGQFEIKDYHFPPPVISGDLATDKVEYTIVVYEVGTFKIPAAEAIAVINGEEKTLKAQPIEITVKSMSAQVKGQKDIFTILDPELPQGSIGKNYIRLFFIIVSLVLFFLVYKFFIKKQRQKVKYIPPPYEEAEIALKSLSKKNYNEQNKHKEYFYELSMIIRKFLERTYKVACTTLTTRQILKEFKKIGVADFDFYQDFFPYADRVKFAKMQPDEKKINEFLKATERIISESRKKAEAEIEKKKKEALKKEEEAKQKLKEKKDNKK